MRDAVERVKAKLIALHDDMPADEREILRTIVECAARGAEAEAEVHGFSASGIGRLIEITQMKADNANQGALKGADRQQGQQPQDRLSFAALIGLL